MSIVKNMVNIILNREEKKLDFTLKSLCEVIDAPINGTFLRLQNQKITNITYNKDEIRPGGVLFDVWNSYRSAEIAEIAKSGCIIITDKSYFDSERKEIPCIKVKSGLEAYNKLGHFVRTVFNIPTIAVTGSIGKTTTVLMLESVFSTKYKTFTSGRNRNTSVYFVDQMIKRMDSSYDIHIQETGGGVPA